MTPLKFALVPLQLTPEVKALLSDIPLKEYPVDRILSAGLRGFIGAGGPLRVASAKGADWMGAGGVIRIAIETLNRCKKYVGRRLGAKTLVELLNNLLVRAISTDNFLTSDFRSEFVNFQPDPAEREQFCERAELWGLSLQHLVAKGIGRLIGQEVYVPPRSSFEMKRIRGTFRLIITGEAMGLLAKATTARGLNVELNRAIKEFIQEETAARIEKQAGIKLRQRDLIDAQVREKFWAECAERKASRRAHAF